MVQVFIFSYDYYKYAKLLLDRFTSSGYDTYLLNCHSPNDPEFPETSHVKKLDNVFYSGQWNESLRYLRDEVALYVNADVVIPNIEVLMKKLKNFYKKHGDRGAIYAPNHYWTPWTYDPQTLPDVGDGCKVVINPDSTIWSLRNWLAYQVGPIDLKINKLGWGIELIASYYATKQKKLVVRDYSIKCLHPKKTAYDRYEADCQWRTMIKKMKLPSDFWTYYDAREQYNFGWEGEDYRLINSHKLFF